MSPPLCSEHSFRHIYVTAGRQLKMPTDQINEMGHWGLNSEMPRVYDSAACTSVRAAKATVTDGTQGGIRGPRYGTAKATEKGSRGRAAAN